MSPEERRRLTVIVTGRALPRKDNLAVQYFARLLGLSGEGDRLIYAESVVDFSLGPSTSWPPTESAPRSPSTSSTIGTGWLATCWATRGETTCRS